MRLKLWSSLWWTCAFKLLLILSFCRVNHGGWLLWLSRTVAHQDKSTHLDATSSGSPQGLSDIVPLPDLHQKTDVGAITGYHSQLGIWAAEMEWSFPSLPNEHAVSYESQPSLVSLTPIDSQFWPPSPTSLMPVKGYQQIYHTARHAYGICPNCTCPNCRKANHAHLKAPLHNPPRPVEKPFVCNWSGCGKRFRQSNELQHHIVIHTGEKKYVCNICNNCFMHSDKLLRYISKPLDVEEKQPAE